MSCRPCFFAVKAIMMYPMQRMALEMILAKYLPVALPNDTRRPFVSVTMMPSAIFPSVACLAELSIRA
jgi:hypothetical protein